MNVEKEKLILLGEAPIKKNAAAQKNPEIPIGQQKSSRR